MQRHDLSGSIFTIADVLNNSECEAMIARADAVGFEAATITAWDGPRLDESRNNDRVILDDVELARSLWERINGSFPAVRSGRQVRGLNERFRFYRYTPGQRFKWHADAPFSRGNGELSLLTFMIYLNCGYVGGATRFESLVVEGRLGMALVFEHGLIHEGAEITEGVKYVLRSDVMFGPIGRFSG